MADLKVYETEAQVPDGDLRHGHVSCGICGMVAQALEDEGDAEGIRPHDMDALSQWSQAHAATHTEQEHRAHAAATQHV